MGCAGAAIRREIQPAIRNANSEKGVLWRHQPLRQPRPRPEDLKKEYVYGLDADSIRRGFLTHLEFTLAELPKHVDSEWEPYVGLALTVRDRLIERWVRTHDA